MESQRKKPRQNLLPKACKILGYSLNTNDFNLTEKPVTEKPVTEILKALKIQYF